MIRNLKALGLAMVAVFAMSAVVASSASADDTGEFTSTTSPTIIAVTGEDVGANDFFEAIGTKIECTGDHFHGEVGAHSPTITITPTYTGCTLGSSPATVTMNGCDYLFHGNGTVDLKCPAGKVVEVHGYTSAAHTTSNCTVTVTPKNGMGTVTYENTNETKAGGDVHVTGTVGGVEGTVHGGSCTLGLTVNFTNAKYVTSATIKAVSPLHGIHVG